MGFSNIVADSLHDISTTASTLTLINLFFFILEKNSLKLWFPEKLMKNSVNNQIHFLAQLQFWLITDIIAADQEPIALRISMLKEIGTYLYKP